MDRTLKIGFIGLDTSHVSAFTKLLNDPEGEHHVAGGRVTIAFPGGSPDFPASSDRVAGFTEELREKYGVNIVDTPEAVAAACDLLFIASVDASVGKPYYVGLLNAIMAHLPHNRSAVPPAEMLAAVAIMEAGNQSRAQAGKAVTL